MVVDVRLLLEAGRAWGYVQDVAAVCEVLRDAGERCWSELERFFALSGKVKESARVPVCGSEGMREVMARALERFLQVKSCRDRC